jgi:hypothetical protein
MKKINNFFLCSAIRSSKAQRSLLIEGSSALAFTKILGIPGGGEGVLELRKVCDVGRG